MIYIIELYMYLYYMEPNKVNNLYEQKYMYYFAR